MKNKTLFAMLLFACILFPGAMASAQDNSSSPETDQTEIPANEKMVILWTSGDREVALKMVFMYTLNAKKRQWWDGITLVVWGPSAKLLTEDKELQDYMGKILESGVTVKACKGCSDQYGISNQLEKLGINVLYVGKELSDYIKEGRNVLTI
jgi:hypothetical protein